MSAPPDIAALIGAAGASFLLGAAPMGLFVARAFGAGDVRKIGSGNIGATNVMRAGGKAAGAATLLLDAAKGFVPALLAGAAFGPWGAAAAGLAAFLGHCYSPFLGFKGGKGVATGLGALLAWSWPAALLCALLFIAIVAASRMVSPASLAAAAAAPALLALLGAAPAALAALLMAAITFWRHRENIGRLMRGEENRVSFGRGAGGEAP
ncbi:MAG: glycerol-3-phosphate 1-O-acyltransferase PlsY [Pseudomonadota bacterium]